MPRSAFRSVRRRRRRRLIYATLLVGCAVLLVAAGAVALRGRELAAELARGVLARAGVATETLSVRTLGFGGIVFDGVRLGGAAGPSAAAIAVDWTLDGLLHGGFARLRVEGLRLTIMLDRGRIAVAGLPPAAPASGVPAVPFDRLEFSDARLNFASATVSASATLEAALTRGADGGLRGTARVASTVTPLGDAPLRIAAELPAWQLGNDGQGFSLAAQGASLTLPERNIALSAAEISLRLAGDAQSLGLHGELRDTAVPPRWPPLTLALEEKRAVGALVIAGHAQSADRALVLTLDGRHDLANGRGTLAIRAAPVVFAPTGRQPRDLFPAAAGSAPSRVAGSVAASGSVSWGGKTMTTALTVALDGVGFAGGLAAVDGLDGTVTFDSLMPLRASGAQHVTANLQIASLPAGLLDLRFRLPSGDRLLIDAATFGLAGGTLSLTDLALQRGQPLDTALDVKAVDIAAVLALIGIDGLSGSGALDGRIPVRVEPAGVTISGGLLGATGAGVVRYSGAGLPAAITEAQGQTGEALTLTRRALADFRYTSLRLTLDRSPSGDGSLLVALKGSNPAVLDNHPFDINIRLDANFDRLAALFLSGYAAADGLLRDAAGR
jgi:dicarboxylate transporter DctA-like protein